MSLPALTYKWSPSYSSRGGARVRLIVVHDCEGSFSGSVSWFMMPKARVSAHIVLSEDGTQAVQMVGWNNKAWHAVDYNAMSEGIEAAGYAAKGLGADEWKALAAIVAWRLHVRGLPPHFAAGGAGDGFCQHKDLGVKGGGHHDITSDPKVWNSFVEMVQLAHAQVQPDNWVSGVSRPALPAVPPTFAGTTTIRHDLVVGSLEWAQMQLNAFHIQGMPALTVDGIDGPETRMVMSSFQRTHGLMVDGELGPQTIGAMKKFG